MSYLQTVEDILTAFRPGDQLTLGALSDRTGKSHKYIAKVLLRMLAEADCAIQRAVVFRSKSVGGTFQYIYYRAGDPAPAGDMTQVEEEAVARTEVPKVGAPYPRVLLHAAPADMEIGRAMRSHATLAMEIRR